MIGRRLKIWSVIGVALILGMMPSRGLALADDARRAFTGDPYFQKPSSALLNTGFFLNFSQRYYEAVETSLQNDSYFAFRYYLASHIESFAKQQFISENSRLSHDLASDALHKAIRHAVDDIELLEIMRAYLLAMTSFQMRIGTDGARLHGPSLTAVALPHTNPEADSDREVTLNSGLTFSDDLRLGFRVAMSYQQIISKLSYYPTSRNEIGYTAETQLTDSSKIGLSYLRSQDGGAVVTTISYLF